VSAVIEVKNMSYRFKGAVKPTIQDISFRVEKGEIFGFLGPSGAGKSTTQKILIGLLTGYAGSVQVFGKEMNQKEKGFYERIGVAFEFPNFYHKLTGLENLNLFKGLYQKETAKPLELLELVGLKGAAKMRFQTYSKGMKMRLNFCRALLNDPDILFLDEPTSGLDPNNSRLLKNIIRKKKEEGKTIILTTHHMHLAEELCDRVAFMVDGQITLTDSPENLKQQGAEKRLLVSFRAEGGPKTLEFPLTNIGTNSQFQRLLKEKEIFSMHTQEKTMEDVFLEVTGRNLHS
jgi:fluoroquinolone transport system ATP-binding protein